MIEIQLKLNGKGTGEVSIFVDGKILERKNMSNEEIVLNLEESVDMLMSVIDNVQSEDLPKPKLDGIVFKF